MTLFTPNVPSHEHSPPPPPLVPSSDISLRPEASPSIKVLGLALVITLMAALLVVAPKPASIPLIGWLREEDVTAHDKQECSLEPYTHYYRGQTGLLLNETRYRQVCRSVAHSHGPSGADITVTAIGTLGCAAIGAGSVAAGVLCATQVGTAQLVSNKS